MAGDDTLADAEGDASDVESAATPEGEEDDAGILARAVVRLAMSYVSMPPESDYDVSADLARLFTPAAERYGVIAAD